MLTIIPWNCDFGTPDSGDNTRGIKNSWINCKLPSLPSSSRSNATRIMVYLLVQLPSWRALASSRIAATPDPLSSTPGESGTVSQWAPTTNTLSKNMYKEKHVAYEIVTFCNFSLMNGQRTLCNQSEAGDQSWNIN